MYKEIAIALTVVALANAVPVADRASPFLSVSVVRPGQASYDTSVSKQYVSTKLQQGDLVIADDEPFTDHRPPFLAFSGRPLNSESPPRYQKPPVQRPYRPVPPANVEQDAEEATF